MGQVLDLGSVVGKDGATILFGTAAPTAAQGVDGDAFINTSNFDFYVKESSAWVKKGNIKGTAGTAGTNGTNGAAGTRGSVWWPGTGITGTATAETVYSGSGVAAALVNDMYINISTFNLYKCTLAGSASVAKWAYYGCIKGANGNAGATGPAGKDAVAPTFTINAAGHLIATYA